MKKIVVLGGGYGGLRIINNLLTDELKDVEIVLIDQNGYHSLKTEFYALAAGTLSDKAVRIDFPEDEKLTKVFGSVEGIDLEEKRVHMQDGLEINFDYLVVALGCEDNYHGIEGAPEHTYSVQNIKKTRLAYSAISNLAPYKDVLVLGGGLSGIEMASEIRESRPDLKIKVLERGDSVLKPFGVKIQGHANKWFEENDVEVICDAVVERIEGNTVYYNGKQVNGDVILWTAGVRPNKVVRDLNVEKDKQDKVVLNEYFQIPTHESVYVVGDCASSSLPPSAQLAEHQADRISDVLLSIVEGENPSVPTPIKLRGTLGSLGKRNGFGKMSKHSLTGFMPRVAKSGVLWIHKRNL